MQKCGTENVEYFVGLGRSLGIFGLDEAINYAFKEYPWPTHLEATRDIQQSMKGLPSLLIIARDLEGKTNQWEVKHKIGFDPKFDANGPALIFRLLKRDGSDRFVNIVPLPAVLSFVTGFQNTYTVYYHEFARRDRIIGRYVGLTKQGWTARWRQHLNAARCGSPYLFHQAIRNRHDDDIELHRIYGCGLPFDEAMNLEEKLVDKLSLHPLHPTGLNMIPGGFAGLRYLHKLGLENISPRRLEHRSSLIRQIIKRSAREGKPSPWLSAMWRSDEFAASRICKNPNNFDMARVQEARLLASFDWSPEKIAEKFSCSVSRVSRLLKGTTYSRVH